MTNLPTSTPAEWDTPETPTLDVSALNAAVEDALPRGLEELTTLVSFPSVAAKSDSPMVPCAEAVADLFRARGFDARLVPTDGGPPVVYADYRFAGMDAPTVLFYNHYDVQPAEPLEAWDSEPFALRIDGEGSEAIAYARGVSDDKGHIICRLMALDALMAANDGKLPINVKVVVEGEEEVSSVHLPAWIEKYAALLNADVCLWEFGGIDEAGRPELTCGLRGIAYFELHARTVAYDAHSGLGGSLFPNAAWRLTWALSTLKDQNEHILLPGHYDRVVPPTEGDLKLLAALPSREAFFKQEYGISDFLQGASGVEYQRRGVWEPTCTICGLSSGWEGEGAKTVLPSTAMAKLDFRLVPDQDPIEVRDSLRKHLDGHGFTDIEVVYLGGQRPGRTDPHHRYVALAARTAQEVYGQSASIIPLSGVSGPMYPFAQGLRLPTVTIGAGYPGARVHAPNENMRASDLIKGAQHTAQFIAALISEGGPFLGRLPEQNA